MLCRWIVREQSARFRVVVTCWVACQVRVDCLPVLTLEVLDNILVLTFKNWLCIDLYSLIVVSRVPSILNCLQTVNDCLIRPLLLIIFG